MPSLKIAVQLAALRQPFRKALVTAARLGATGVEIDARGEFRSQDLGQTGLRELRRLLEEHSLKVVAVGFATRRGYDVVADLDRRISATKAALKFAADLRCPVVVNQVGQVPAVDDPRWQVMIESLRELGAYGQHVGAVLAAQTGTESGADLKRLLDALPTQALGVDLDPANLIVHGFSPAEAVQELGSSILHVHARDGVRDLARGRGVEVELGRGSADFPYLCGALEERQYRGYFTVGREESEEPEYEFGEAIKYLNSL